MNRYIFLLIFISITFTAVQASELSEACQLSLSKVKEALTNDSLAQAERFASEALTHANSSSDSAQCYSAIGKAFYRAKIYDQAISYTEMAIMLQVDSLYSTAEAYYYHGRSLFQIGEPDSKFISDYERVVTLLGQYNHFNARQLRAFTFIKAGQFYTKIGDTDRAQNHYFRALILGKTDEFKKTTVAENSLIELGVTYYVESQYSDAIDCYEEALLLDFQNPFNKILTYYRLAEAHIALENYEKASTILEKVISMYEAEEDIWGILEAKALKGELFLKMGLYEEAISILSEVFSFFDGTEKDREIGKMYLIAGSAYFKLNQFDHALIYFQKALQTVIRDSLPLSADPRVQPTEEMIYAENVFQDGLNGKGQVFMARYQNSENLQDLENAFSSFYLAMIADDSLREEFGSISSKSLISNETHWRTEFALEIAYLLEKKKDSSMIDQAFFLMEHSRAKDLIAAKSKASIEGPKQISALRKELKMELAQCQTEWSQDPTVSLDSACAYVLYQYDSLLEVMEREYPSHDSDLFKFTMKSLEEIQSHLHTDEALIEYFWGEKQLFGLMLTKDSARWKLLDERGLTTDLLNKLELSRQTSDYATASILNKLYLKLLAPFGKLPSSLIIIPDANLHTLSFEALLTRSSDSLKMNTLGSNFWKGRQKNENGAAYLLYEHPIQYAYSATLLFSDKKNYSSGTKMASFAPTYTKQDSFQGYLIPPLNGNTEHAKRLAEKMGGESYLGPAANRTAFLGLAEDYRFLHLALHGYANKENPLLAMLAFSSTEEEEGMVSAANLYGMPTIEAELVSLLSCETGAGQYVKGEGIMSLARAFRYAGARSVLMSLWQADTGPGIEIMESFYKYLDKDMSKSQAIQKAKLDWLSNADAIDAHPSKWANFVLIGDGSPIRRESAKWPYILAGIFLLVATSIWVFRRNRV